MREIEFRAWDTENEIMVYDNENDTYGYWDGCQDSDIGMINHLLNRKEYIFMQYTGLKDKKGVKIFEGDIITVLMVEGYEQFVAGWSDEYNGFRFTDNDGTDWNITSQNDIEVIGNIYDNPELLK